ncbi:MAG TPA: patatin-like phospholipase family protein [Blastocatellia bacterium]|nr:patatin-like phospholipase family protein [Blastocatellia bacterium]
MRISCLRTAAPCRQLLCLWLSALALAWLVPPEAPGQQATPQAQAQRRPRIGLALSGGGARGLAHIGVLRWFEEHRIPVDYLAGTSMGGLVGGLYATGRGPSEMRQLVGGLDWDVLLRGYQAFRELSYRRKEDRLYIPGPITIGFKNGLRFPSGINAGHEIGLLFDRLMLPYDDVGSFDNLPIPFRCVATDLVAAEPVVLKEGSLADALRATMSIPGLFSPVEVQGKLLADGGILNNVPTDVVKEMGADIVIAVDIGTPLGDRASIDGFFGVLSQTSGVATMENVRRDLRLADLLISPDLEKYTLLDFTASEAISELGYKGAEQKALLLEKLAVGEEEWRDHLAQRAARARTAVPTPAFVKVEGVGAEEARALAERLGEFAGQPLDSARIQKELTSIKGEGRFDTLNYAWVRDGGRDGLVVRAREKSYGPPFLDIGLQIDNAATDDTNFNVLGRLTFFGVGRPGSEWRTDFSLGSRLQLGTEYFFPLSKEGKLFLAPNASIDEQQRSFFQGGEKVAEYSQRTARAGVDLAYILNSRSELRAGYSIGHLKGERNIGDPVLPDVSGTQSVAGVRFNYYGQNSPQFPTRGVIVRSRLNWFFKSPGAVEAFPQGEVQTSVSHILADKNVIFARFAGGTSFSQTAAPFNKFALGGLFRLGGYGRDEFLGDHYLLGEAGYLRRLHRLPPLLGGSIFAGGWYDGGSAFNKFDEAKYQMSGTGGMIIETRLGPVFVGGSWAEGGRGKFYFALGRLF